MEIVQVVELMKGVLMDSVFLMIIQVVGQREIAGIMRTA